ncbi:hypothetical protein INR49_023709 [Caranx melampygus]|nr:hypothetical protein INR49_023709 [Caranx melampygus]
MSQERSWTPCLLPLFSTVGHCALFIHAVPSSHITSNVFNRLYSYTCELKRNTAVTAVSSSNTTSGFPAFQCLMADSWVTAQHDGINFKGCGFRTVQGADNATACQSACNADRNCQFYTYVKQSFSDTSQRKRCYLKRVITMPVPLKVIALQQAVSGFSTNICL